MADRTGRMPNRVVCESYRMLLTSGFFIPDDSPISKEEALAITKPWRAELWRAFMECENRMLGDKMQAHEHKKLTGNK